VTRISAVLLLLWSIGPCSKATEGGPSVAATVAPTVAAPDNRPADVEPSLDDLAKGSSPLVLKPIGQELAGSKIAVESCKLDVPLLGKSAISLLGGIRAIGDHVYLVYSGQVHAFKVTGTGCRLSLDRTFGKNGATELDAKVERLSADAAGGLWATSGTGTSFKIGKDGKSLGKCNGKPLGHMHVHPNGKYAIGTFGTEDTAFVTIAGASCVAVPWSFSELAHDEKRQGIVANAQAVGYFGDMIYMGAKLAASADPREPTVVLGLDTSGQEKLRIGGNPAKAPAKERIDWVHAIMSCKPGLCVLDASQRRLTVWRPNDGKFVGSLDLAPLFGANYPWVADFDRGPKNTYFSVAQEREGGRIVEGNVFRVTGL
jgi:hypothetical protein